jgi:uncharacterized protein YlxW (UPF0749 family)
VEDGVSIEVAGGGTPSVSAAKGSGQRHALVDLPHLATFRLSKQGLLLLLLGIALGALVAANLQSKAKPLPTRDDYPRQIAAYTIERLEAEQAELKRQIVELRHAIAERQEQAATEKSALAGINAALEQQKSAAGMTALKGPGIRLVLDDSAANAIPAGDDPSFYIIHEYQLRDVVNLLWGAGAEAIAINNERLVTTSSIYCVGSTILVNNTRLSAPYELVVIGDPQTLEDALNNPSNLKSLKTRIKVYGLQLKVARQREVTVPPFNGSLVTRYASLVER